jgi:hypothetical protein
MNFYEFSNKLKKINEFEQPAPAGQVMAPTNAGLANTQNTQGTGAAPAVQQDPAVTNIMKLIPTIKDQGYKDLFQKALAAAGQMKAVQKPAQPAPAQQPNVQQQPAQQAQQPGVQQQPK